MSRIGKLPITLPKGVEVKIEKNRVTIKGAKGTMTQVVDHDMKVSVENGILTVARPSEQKRQDVYKRQGKGAVEYYVALVQPGRILFEMEGTTLEAATKALNMAAQKLPIKTKVVVRHDI